MYRSRDSELHGVEFAYKPFNELFWDLWAPFARYLIQELKASLKRNPGPGEYLKQTLGTVEVLDFDVDSEPLVSPQEVIDLFEAALKQPGWMTIKLQTSSRGLVARTPRECRSQIWIVGVVVVTLTRGRYMGSVRAWGLIWSDFRRSDRRGVEYRNRMLCSCPVLPR